MAATQANIREWLERAKALGKTHLIIVCDTFDHDDYPIYVAPGDDVRETYNRYHNMNMQRVMEVYKLDMDWEQQLNPMTRAFNL